MHPLLYHELTRAHQDDLLRDARPTARATNQAPADDKRVPVRRWRLVRWRRYALVVEAAEGGECVGC